MLEGYDNGWSPVSKNSSATFGNMHEGNYTFKVKAQSPNGVWCAPVTYTFRVLPPWYRTWWAYSIYGLAFLFVLGGFIKWREGKLRKEKKKLEQTVEERTEQLLQKNTVITKLVNEQEQTIQVRTAELAASNDKLIHANKKLVELIQYNAHNLREPLMRISGAMVIQEYLPTEEFFEDIWPQMRKAVTDLDDSIKNVINIADETVEFKH
jgi:signal transduction histidine kinase